jgi:ElaB/YqjD/DUF883 family membrane-anchored ribosome-binding protein
MDQAPAPKKLKPRAEVARAKAQLIDQSNSPASHPAADLIRRHPAASVGLAAIFGFAIVVIKPGRLLMRQVLMAGTGILLRKALLKYLMK